MAALSEDYSGYRCLDNFDDFRRSFTKFRLLFLLLFLPTLPPSFFPFLIHPLFLCLFKRISLSLRVNKHSCRSITRRRSKRGRILRKKIEICINHAINRFICIGSINLSIPRRHAVFCWRGTLPNPRYIELEATDAGSNHFWAGWLERGYAHSLHHVDLRLLIQSLITVKLPSAKLTPLRTLRISQCLFLKIDLNRIRFFTMMTLLIDHDFVNPGTPAVPSLRRHVLQLLVHGWMI